MAQLTQGTKPTPPTNCSIKHTSSALREYFVWPMKDYENLTNKGDYYKVYKDC